MEHNWFKSFMKLVLIGIDSKVKIPWKKTAQAFWDMYIHRFNWANPVRLAQIISRPVPINPNVSDPKEKL